MQNGDASHYSTAAPVNLRLTSSGDKNRVRSGTSAAPAIDFRVLENFLSLRCGLVPLNKSSVALVRQFAAFLHELKWAILAHDAEAYCRNGNYPS